jgi:hypothetical protein
MILTPQVATAERKVDRQAWGLAAVLAVVVLGGIGMLGTCLRPYWVAKYRGEGADLSGAMLIRAPLQGAVLESADLSDADLRGADMKGSYLGDADLTGADLRGADLRGAAFCLSTTIDGVPQPETIADFTSARYNKETRWPDALYNPYVRRSYRFDPQRHGAILVR